MMNDVVQKLTYPFILKGERGPEGGRGRPGEDGLKGAKVRGVLLAVGGFRANDSAPSKFHLHFVRISIY